MYNRVMFKETSWHNFSWKEAIKLLNSDLDKGLSEKEVGKRQKEFGLNSLPEDPPLSQLKIFLSQLKSPLIYILLIAGFITLVLREFTDSIVIFGAVILNSIVGFFQENKASKALSELKKIVKIKAQVIREGNEIEIESKDLVPGDIIVLNSGNKVPADARLIEAFDLKINEMALTGEWMAAEKIIEVLSEKTPMADRDNMVYTGTLVETGKGKAVVTGIGEQTEIGKVAQMVKEGKEEKTPLQKKLTNLSRMVGLIITIIVVLIFFGGIIRGGEPLEMFMTSVAVAVAAIPEGLPVAMTVILTLGIEKILRKKGLVRKLIAAETLGSTSIICSDKTLTLTEGKMKVSETITLKSEVIPRDSKEWQDIFQEKKNKDQILLMSIASINNEAFVENPEDLPPVWRVRGRATDKALILAGAIVDIKNPDLQKEYVIIDELPLNSENKFLAKLVRKNNKFILFVDGAPEKILDLSKKVEIGGEQKDLDDKARDKFKTELERLTNNALRVVSVSYKEYGESFPKYKKIEELCNDLVFVGLIGLKDPLRKEAKEAIATVKKAGMKLIIVTGDHLLTAKAVAREIGLEVNDENVIEGAQLDQMSDEEFKDKVKDIEVYARVDPRHKMRIVTTWQEKGEVVAMTGDGINDAPALKKADIGVALGSGTDVAKEVSDLVLLTDNFNIIVAAVAEGRSIVDNIKKVITYLLADSFTETILIGVSVIFGLPLPVTAAQILWVNLVEDGLPSVALSFEPEEKDVMERRPLKQGAPLLTKEMKTIIFIIGILTDLILLGIFFWLLNNGSDIQYVRTMVFVALGINSLFYIFSCKSLRRNIWHINPFSNKFLVFSVAIGFLALFSAIYLVPFQTLLKTVPLGLSDLAIVFGFGFVNIIFIEAAKWYFITKHQIET